MSTICPSIPLKKESITRALVITNEISSVIQMNLSLLSITILVDDTEFDVNTVITII